MANDGTHATSDDGGDRPMTDDGVTGWLETAREQRWGILVDLMFAIVWVTLVEALFTFVDGPQWAYYLLMLSGIGVYFAFVWNLELAREWYRS